jgi:protoporphyrinogen oxidase
MTGLAAGAVTGAPIYEARQEPGGICSSYYLAPGASRKTRDPGARPTAYRFEYGGGHWIFGGDPAVLALIRRFGEVRRYTRHSAVYFAQSGRFVPFPIQYHLSHLGQTVAAKAASEMAASRGEDFHVLRDWLYDRFGPTLCDLFFGPFNERYTGGLWTVIAPQDGYKSPFRMEEVIKGMQGQANPAGYNVSFLYPPEGLDVLVSRLAELTKIDYNKEVVGIDPEKRVVQFHDGTFEEYGQIISTLPLCKMTTFTGLDAGEPDPYTSVLVLNIGATKGTRCPPHHWLYAPDSRAGFHRVGFYSNVDPSFLPSENPKSGTPADRVSIYVEFAFPGGKRLSKESIEALSTAAVEELKAWQFIGEVEVLDPTWIEIAYTWSVHGSSWKPTALTLLEAHGIYQVGRYGRWTFQGIANSLRDGLMVGAALGVSESD